jgi:BirA family biotin operon repressor/biotin-[acetyl-CoA-carboxylase] ligase
MKTRLELLSLLADGRFHSGEALGTRLGVSRTAVWKQIQSLQKLGIDCHSVSGKGYRLARPLELHDREAVLTAMDDVGRELLSTLELHPEIDSTNRHLMQQLSQGLEPGHACLVERQLAGRGRRGRGWESPFARNIYLSFYWRFEMNPSLLSGLGLALGVGVIRALRRLDVYDASLKWPNDILWQGRKLAGILLEMSGEAAGPYHVVAGVGMNVNMDGYDHDIDQPWIDLHGITPEPLSRNRVAGVLLSELLQVASEFQQHGLAPFIDEWSAADAYAGREVLIHLAQQRIPGRAAGVDTDGSILVETDEGLRRFHSGEVSLRLPD